MIVTIDMPSAGHLGANFIQKLVTFLSSARLFSTTSVLLEFFSDEQRGLSLVDFFVV